MASAHEDTHEDGHGGRGPDAAARLLPLVYGELQACARRVMRGERADHTLQPTALVHEAFARLADQTRVEWKGQTHFMAVAAEAMRRVLIDHARARGRLKRAGPGRRVQMADPEAPGDEGGLDVLAVDEALKKLASIDARQARVVELRFFAGLSLEQIAEVLGVSARTVDAEWAHAKAWLKRELAKQQSRGDG